MFANNGLLLTTVRYSGAGGIAPRWSTANGSKVARDASRPPSRSCSSPAGRL